MLNLILHHPDQVAKEETDEDTEMTPLRKSSGYRMRELGAILQVRSRNKDRYRLPVRPVNPPTKVIEIKDEQTDILPSNSRNMGLERR